MGVLRELIVAIRVKLSDRDLKSSLDGINKIEKALSSVAAIYLAKRTVSFFSDMISEVTNASLKLDALSKKLGLSTGFVQAFQLTAEATGVSLTRSVRAIERFNQRIGEARLGVRHSALAFGYLHVALTDGMGGIKDNERIFMETAASLVSIKDDAERARLAAAVFGESGAELIPLLQVMGTEFESTSRLIAAYDAGLTDAQRTQDLQFRKSLVEMKIISLGVKKALVEAALPAIIKAGKSISAFFLSNKEKIKAYVETIGSVVGWFGGLFGTMVQTITSASSTFVNAIDSFAKSVSEANPILKAFVISLAVMAGTFALSLMPVLQWLVILYVVIDLIRDLDKAMHGEQSFFKTFADGIKMVDDALLQSGDRLSKWYRTLQGIFGVFKGLWGSFGMFTSFFKSMELETINRWEKLPGETDKDFEERKNKEKKLRGLNDDEIYDYGRRMMRLMDESDSQIMGTGEFYRPRIKEPSAAPGPTGMNFNLNINNEVQTGPTVSTAKEIGEEIGMSTSQLLRRELQQSGFALTVQSA